MILYILLSLFILYILFFLYIKIKFRFWSVQPVFHLYNLYYWLFPVGIIQKDMPPITKFYDGNILTKSFKDISTEKKALLCWLVQSHFLNNKKTKYNPPKHAILDYFKAHNSNSFISLQLSNHFYKNNRANIISAMTSRPLICHIYKHKIQVNYVDFLCVHKKHRKQGNAQKIIYSHYRDVRRMKSNPVFLFKREGHINFIVPLTIYNAYAFSLKHLKTPTFELPNNIVCQLINNGNFPLFLHFFGEIKKEFNCFITPCISHIKHLISKKLLFICLIIENNKPVGVYIYRRPYTSYKGKESIECIASYYKLGYYDIYKKSFRNSIVLINKIYPIDIAIIENISNNTDIVKYLMKKTPVLWKCPMAYFLYNFAHRPFLSSNVFLIN